MEEISTVQVLLQVVGERVGRPAVLPALTRLAGSPVLRAEQESGFVRVVVAGLDPTARHGWWWQARGLGAFADPDASELPMDRWDAEGGTLATLRRRLEKGALAGTLSAVEAAALGEIAEIEVAQRSARADAAATDAAIIAEMDYLRGRLILLSDIRARHAERVVALELPAGTQGAQKRAAARLGLGESNLSRLLAEGRKRRAGWNRTEA